MHVKDERVWQNVYCLKLCLDKMIFTCNKENFKRWDKGLQGRQGLQGLQGLQGQSFDWRCARAPSEILVKFLLFCI